MLKKHQKIKRNFPIEFQNVGELLLKRMTEKKNEIFLIIPGIKEEIFTYAQVQFEIGNLIKIIAETGLKKGDSLNLLIPNSSAFIKIYFAAILLGIIVVPINEDLAPAEIAYIINDCHSKAIFFDPALKDKIELTKPLLKNKIMFLPNSEVKNTHTSDSFQNLPKIDLSDPAIIIYTSGTTGNPKGVVLNHLNLLADSKAVANWFHFTTQDRTLCILPLFHNNGQIITLLIPLYAGASTVIVKGKASLMSFWGLIQKYRITWTSVMPAILSILLSLKIERSDYSMKGIICGGQILNRSVQQAFEKRFNVPIFEGFGLTETTSFACFNKYPQEKRKIGSVGTPLSINEMTILDEHDLEMPPFKEGEICIRGLNVATEYLGLPEKNLTAFRNGWFHSGDFGYQDAKNNFYFKTRKDFLIIKGGENIYPAELENVLFTHPKVSEVAVVGIPDSLLGEDICAFVKLKESEKGNEAELKKFCQGKIAKYKQAKRILIIDHLPDLKEIPKGPTKKVLYRKLKEYYVNHKP